MHWLDDAKESPPASDGPPSSRRGPPRLPGVPEIPPMPVAPAEGPPPTNKTIEVEPHWLELVEERRAQNAKKAASAGEPPAPTKKAAAPVAPTSPPDASRPRPRLRPIIPRGDD